MSQLFIASIHTIRELRNLFGSNRVNAWQNHGQRSTYFVRLDEAQTQIAHESGLRLTEVA